MNTLFLSAATGGGHDKAAEAIIECMKQRNPGSGILLSDSLKNISPAFDRLVVGTYLHTIKNTPNIYGTLYKLSETNESITDITKSLNRIFSFRLNDIIKAAAPSLIVSTHTIPLQMLSTLKRKGKLDIPVIGIVTDFTNHYFWKLDNIDALIVANEYIKDDMVKMGVPGSRIFTYGIPVCSCFRRRRDRNSLLSELGLKNKTTVLVMGGSLGLGNIRRAFGALLECKRDIQIIAVTGLNRKLEGQLTEMAAAATKNVRILSFTNRVSDLMDLSDVIITKPGGVTIAEALVKRIPIVIMSPLPGQEERNANFLLNSGVASRLYPGDDIDNILHQILDNPVRLRQMKEMANFLAQPDAAEKTAELMESLSGAYISSKSVQDINCLQQSAISASGTVEAVIQKY